MDIRPEPFVPPAPAPRTGMLARWRSSGPRSAQSAGALGPGAFTMPVDGDEASSRKRTLVVNHPGLIRHLLVDNVSQLCDVGNPPARAAADPA